MRQALILGGGITALSCARLLARQGWQVELRGGGGKTPPLVLKALTAELLADVWDAADLLQETYPLQERRVRWGGDMAGVAEAGRTVRSQLLIGRLREQLTADCGSQVTFNPSSAGDMSLFDWVLDAGGRASRLFPASGSLETAGGQAPSRRRFGNRVVAGTEVALARELHACWIEAVPNGWVFMAPLARDRALLQAMLPAEPPRATTVVTRLLEWTREIRTLVTGTLYPPILYDATPQIAEPLCGEGWLRVGDAAICFDPICGDGVGYALRGAILATAVLEAVARGLPAAECLQHYTDMLHLTFARHLRECLKHYAAGFDSPAWQAELKLMSAPAGTPELTRDNLRFGLLGFDLVPLRPEKQ